MSPVKSATPGTAAVLQITTNSQGQPLNKGQKRFNQLSKKVLRLRQQIGQWLDLLPIYQQQYQERFVPLLAEYNQRRLVLVRLFDVAYVDKKLNKSERRYMRLLIEQIIQELIEYEPNDELKALFARYIGQNFDEHESAMQQDLTVMLRTKNGHGPDGRESAEGRRPSQRERKQQAEQALAEAQLGQTLREMYRKLASALHPDREGDASERERKTALMSRVNVAYDNKDLLGLLELQLEVEQIDASLLNSMSEERLKHFNRVLAGQVEELQLALRKIYYLFQLRFPDTQSAAGRGVPLARTRLRYLMQEVAQLGTELESLNLDLVVFQDLRKLKQWLGRMIAAERLRQQQEAHQMIDLDWLFVEGPGGLKPFFDEPDD